MTGASDLGVRSEVAVDDAKVLRQSEADSKGYARSGGKKIGRPRANLLFWRVCDFCCSPKIAECRLDQVYADSEINREQEMTIKHG